MGKSCSGEDDEDDEDGGGEEETLSFQVAKIFVGSDYSWSAFTWFTIANGFSPLYLNTIITPLRSLIFQTTLIYHRHCLFTSLCKFWLLISTSFFGNHAWYYSVCLCDFYWLIHCLRCTYQVSRYSILVQHLLCSYCISVIGSLYMHTIP